MPRQVPRRPKGYISNHGKIPIGNELSARPVEALERTRFGDWEVDTIVGYKTAILGVEFYFPPPRELQCGTSNRVADEPQRQVSPVVQNDNRHSPAPLKKLLT